MRAMCVLAKMQPLRGLRDASIGKQKKGMWVLSENDSSSDGGGGGRKAY